MGAVGPGPLLGCMVGAWLLGLPFEKAGFLFGSGVTLAPCPLAHGSPLAGLFPAAAARASELESFPVAEERNSGKQGPPGFTNGF